MVKNPTLSLKADRFLESFTPRLPTNRKPMPQHALEMLIQEEFKDLKSANCPPKTGLLFLYLDLSYPNLRGGKKA